MLLNETKQTVADGAKTWSAHRSVLVCAVLVILALLVRLPHFASRALWYDEAVQYRIAEPADVREVLRRVVAEDRAPPGYAILEHVSLRFGTGEVWARLPSLLAGLVTIVVAWVAADTWLGAGRGPLASLLCVLAPPLVFYAREGRAYASGAALAFLWLAVVGRLARTPRASAGAWILAAIVAAICVFWQYLLAVPVAVGLLVVLGSRLGQRDGARAGLAAWFGLAAIVSLSQGAVVWWFLVPQVRLRGTGHDDVLYDFTYDLTSHSSIGTFLATNFVEFLEYPLLGVDIGPRWRLLAVGAWGTALLLGVTWCAREGQRGRALLALAGVPVAVTMCLAGVRVHPFGAIRHCLPLLPGLLVLATAGLAEARRRLGSWGHLGTLAILATMAYGTWLTTPGKHVHDVRELLAELRARSQEGEALVLAGVGAKEVFHHYLATETWPGEVVFWEGPETGRGGPTWTRRPYWVVTFPFDTGPRFDPANQDLADDMVPREKVEKTGVEATRWCPVPGP